MRSFISAGQPFRIFLVSLICMVANPLAALGQDECQASGELEFICGLKNPEDLVQLPGTRWVIASGMATDAYIYLIDSQAKTWVPIYPSKEVAIAHDREVYGACPGAPDPKAFVSHGLNLQPGGDGHSRLYVVAHGAREAVEAITACGSGRQIEIGVLIDGAGRTAGALRARRGERATRGRRVSHRPLPHEARGARDRSADVSKVRDERCARV